METIKTSTIRKVRIVLTGHKREVCSELDFYNPDADFDIAYLIDSYQAARQIPIKMTGWVSKLDGFLQFNEYDLLQDAGKVSHKAAYDRYRIIQDHNYESDFDKEVKKLKKKKPGNEPKRCDK